MAYPIQQAEGFSTRFQYGVVPGGHTLSGTADALGISPGQSNYILSGNWWITGAAVDAITLAQPNSGGGLAPSSTVFPSQYGMDDYELMFMALSAYAHTITTSSNGINGNKHIATFAAAVGNNIVLVAKSGVWYVQSSVGVTLS